MRRDAVDAVRPAAARKRAYGAAIALFLAREPLIDMASKLASGVGTKRKARSARKAQTKQKAPLKAPTRQKAPTKQKDTETIE